MIFVMPHLERGFASIVVILIVVFLVLAAGGFWLKSQGNLSFSNKAGTNQSLTPSGKTIVPDFASAMKELGCSDQTSCMSICLKPENINKCKSLMQSMGGNQQVNIDENNLPKIVQADFIDLAKITRISKFRSGEGHDFSAGDETCRSMKHYFYSSTSYPLNPQTYVPPAPYINIYSPVDGIVTAIDIEHTPIGKQIHIQTSSHSDYALRLFHVYPIDGLNVGSTVRAGDKIGYIGSDGATDIAVEVGSFFNHRYISYFSILPDDIFQHYKDRGLNSRDDVIISRQYRDQHPLGCTGEEFNVKGGNPENNVTLSK